MSETHRRDPGGVRPDLRELLRTHRSAVNMTRSLRTTDREVRIGLPKIAWEIYETVPDYTAAVYYPGMHVFALDLPEPEVRI